MTHFGRFTEATQPGLRYHLPFPIEAVEVVDFSQVKTVEIGYRNSNPKNKIAKESLMLTDDENIIDIQFAVQYNLKNAAGVRIQCAQARRHRGAGRGDRRSAKSSAAGRWISRSTRDARRSPPKPKR